MTPRLTDNLRAAADDHARHAALLIDAEVEIRSLGHCLREVLKATGSREIPAMPGMHLSRAVALTAKFPGLAIVHNLRTVVNGEVDEGEE